MIDQGPEFWENQENSEQIFELRFLPLSIGCTKGATINCCSQTILGRDCRLNQMLASGSLTGIVGGIQSFEKDGMSLEKTQKAALIVTFFPKSRLTSPNLNSRSTSSSEDGSQDGTKTTKLPLPSYVAFFPSLMAQLVPHFEHVSTHALTSHIAQSTYAGLYQDLPDFSSLRHNAPIREFERKNSLEVIFDVLHHASGHQHRPLRLALFDMDSTLINEEVIDELARSIGISDAVSAITARAMNGEIDFATSLSERVAMLKGVPSDIWEDLKKTVTITTGARELVSGLKRKGVLTGVVSGGFMPMAEWLKGELGLDVAVANYLLEEGPRADIPHPHLSGLLDPNYPIVTPELKRETLKSLAIDHAIPLSETLAVGDGSNDLLMLGTAGLGIAWNAKEMVQTRAPMRLNGNSLADVLYLIL